MKIGILIKEFEKLSNWELRIIQNIIDDPKLELSLLVQDGRKGSQSKKIIKNKLSRFFLKKNILGKLLFKFQVEVEKKKFKKSLALTVDKEKIISSLVKINIIKLKPQRSGSLDIFNADDSERINNYKLDIILKLGFNTISGGILESAKYGIWSLHHSDISMNRGEPAGFWEIVLKHSSVGVTLLQLAPGLNEDLVIDNAFINWHWSFVVTNNLILETSVSLLFKNIRKLEKGDYSPVKSTVYYNPLYRSPNLYYTIKYALNYYISLLKKKVWRINYKLLGIRHGCWTLFIGKGDFMNSTLFKLKPTKLPKGEFWADPFLIKYEKEHYVFFENYSYESKKGKISCGRFSNNKLLDVTDVLDLDYHLSYPFIFEEDGDVFLMPETSNNNRLEIYKCINFPDTWELYSTAFEGEKVVDAIFFDDEHKQKWLFVNKKATPALPGDIELFIYKVDSLKMDKLVPHEENPVIINSKIARNAGAIFKYGNDIFRPSQCNIDGVYGRALNINKIKKLTITEYIEERTITVMPNFHEGLKSTHHLHQIDDYFVMDAAYRKTLR